MTSCFFYGTLKELVVTNSGLSTLSPTYKKGETHSMTLRTAEEGKSYVVQKIAADDAELVAFLFSLGCYSGESITVISHRAGGCIVSIKDGRYHIDAQLADVIYIA